MTNSTQPKPSYLEPSSVDLPQPEVIYEPPIQVGTEIRLGEDIPLEQRTFRYNHVKTGEPMELVTPAAQHFTVAGFQELEVWKFNPSRVEFDHPDHEWKHVGYRNCFYAVTGKEIEPVEDKEAIIKAKVQDADDKAFIGFCEQNNIQDRVAYLRANYRKWVCGPSGAWQGRKYFDIGEGDFHSALIGGTWVPVVRGSVRQQTVPVLGFEIKGARQTSHKGKKQTKGHKGGIRAADGTFATESDIQRRRWTTTLDVECLKVLEQISKETGQHRNEIVEELIREAYG